MVIKPINLLVGKEPLLRDEAIRNILKEVFTDPSQKEFNLSRLDANKDGLSDLLTQAKTAPFLASKRVIIVDHVDAFKDADRRMLLSYLEQPCKTSVLILMTDERAAKAGFLKNIAECGQSIFCDAPYKDAEVKQWIFRKMGEHQKRIDSASVALIFEHIGKNMAGLSNAVGQLATYVGARPNVTQQDVAALLGESSDQNIFQLYDVLKEGKLDEALRILNRLKGQGKRSHEILASLVWQFERVIKIKKMLNQGLRDADISSKLRIHAFFVGKAVRQVEKLSEKDLQNDLQALLDCDWQVKHGELREDLALEKCALSLNKV